MSSEVEFHEVALGELINSIAMGPFGSDLKVDNFTSSGVPVLRGGNLYGFTVDDTETPFVTQQKADSLARSKAFPGDLVATHRGTIGQVSIVPRKSRFPEYLVSQSQLKITLNESLVVPEYLTYWFRGDQGQFQLLSYANQTGVPAIAQPTKSFKNMRVRLPGVPVQSAVVEVLGALDDKIAANLGVCRRAVDLGIAYLRSACLSQRAIGEISTVTMGTSPKGEQLNEVGEGLPFFQGVRDFGGVQPIPRVYTEHPVRQAEPWSTLLAVRAPVGRVNLAAVDSSIGRGLASLKSPNAPATLFLAMKEFCSVWDEYEGSGTVFSSVNGQQVRSTKIPYPLDSELVDIEDKVAPLLERGLASSREAKVLAVTRDELLPLLMSGRITVKDAERRVEQEV